eukprot:2983468-Rhodomonas_salina.1
MYDGRQLRAGASGALRHLPVKRRNLRATRYTIGLRAASGYIIGPKEPARRYRSGLRACESGQNTRQQTYIADARARLFRRCAVLQRLAATELEGGGCGAVCDRDCSEELFAHRFARWSRRRVSQHVQESVFIHRIARRPSLKLRRATDSIPCSVAFWFASARHRIACVVSHFFFFPFPFFPFFAEPSLYSSLNRLSCSRALPLERRA